MNVATPDMKIKAIAPWFGGKRKLAGAIIEELGDHRVYWEPFCGSLAVLLAKPACVMETANDLHRDVLNLARVIQHAEHGPRLYRRLRRTLMHEQLFRDSADSIRGESCDQMPDPQRAYDYFTTAWLGRNGVAGTSNYNSHFCVRYTAHGGHAAKRWQSAIASIPGWRRRLANVTFLCRDAFELLPRIEDRRGTALYVDPPYMVKGALYVHDFGKISDSGFDSEKAIQQHRRLAKELHRFRAARVVLSYYEHPLVHELYPDWHQRRITVSKALSHQGRRGPNDSKAEELLITNGPSFASSQRELFANP